MVENLLKDNYLTTIDKKCMQLTLNLIEETQRQGNTRFLPNTAVDKVHPTAVMYITVHSNHSD